MYPLKKKWNASIIQQCHTIPSTKPPCLGSQLLSSGGNDWKSCCQRTSTDCITICQSFSRERNWQLVILKNGNQASGMWQCTSILMWTDEFPPFIIPHFWHYLIHSVSHTNVHSTWTTNCYLSHSLLNPPCFERFIFVELHTDLLQSKNYMHLKF